MIKKRSSNPLAETLGELELGVLDVVWRNPGLDAKTICTRFPVVGRPGLSTVQSTVERLHKKGLLRRVKQGHAYFYSAEVSRNELIGKMMSHVIGAFHDGKLDTVLSSFVSAAVRLDSGSLDKLEKMIAEKKKLLSEGEHD